MSDWTAADMDALNEWFKKTKGLPSSVAERLWSYWKYNHSEKGKARRHTYEQTTKRRAYKQAWETVYRPSLLEWNAALQREYEEALAAMSPEERALWER